MTDLEVALNLGFDSVSELTAFMVANHSITEEHFSKLTSEAKLRLYLWEEHYTTFDEHEYSYPA